MDFFILHSFSFPQIGRSSSRLAMIFARRADYEETTIGLQAVPRKAIDWLACLFHQRLGGQERPPENLKLSDTLKRRKRKSVLKTLIREIPLHSPRGARLNCVPLRQKKGIFGKIPEPNRGLSRNSLSELLKIPIRPQGHRPFGFPRKRAELP